MSAAPQLFPTDPIAVFLDFDGTLAHIVERPDLARVPASLLAALRDAYTVLDGALALVTGRSIASLDALLEPLQLPAAGVHGIEYRDVTGGIHSVSAPPVPDWARTELIALAASAPGLLLEDKGHGVALHFRQAPEHEARVREGVRKVFARLGTDFAIQDGKMVVELRPSCATKGTAVARFMENPPFAGRQPVFIGDDITDEDAFRVVNELDGYSIKVGRRHSGSAARYELADVGAVRKWLMPLTQPKPGQTIGSS
jgi:trehalose 6-phosphate phosphatase